MYIGLCFSNILYKIMNMKDGGKNENVFYNYWNSYYVDTDSARQGIY